MKMRFWVSMAACLLLPMQTTQAGNALFLGNSYTASNNLPSMVAQLAASGGQTLSSTSRAPGGYTLGTDPSRHDTDATSLGMIADGGWSYVVLQEQSQLPTIPAYRLSGMYPGARRLDEVIHAAAPCARTVLFMTWGRENGGKQCGGGQCSDDFEDFAAMQASLTEAYTTLGTELGAPVAPVGVAWGAAMEADATVDLFQSDGSHPSAEGSYLAACVFYATLFSESPVGLGYVGGLSASRAAFLQEIAWQTVSQGSWGSATSPPASCASSTPAPTQAPAARTPSQGGSIEPPQSGGCAHRPGGAQPGAVALFLLGGLLASAGRRRTQAAAPPTGGFIER